MSSNAGGMHGQQPDERTGPLQLSRQLMGRKHSGRQFEPESIALSSPDPASDAEASELPRLESVEQAMSATAPATRAIWARDESNVMPIRVYSRAGTLRSTKGP
jgi:hypothetical protein